MHPLLSDAQFNSLALIIIAMITASASLLAAYWSRGAKKDSAEAKQNSAEAKVDSAEARENSANALHEVKTNGGMSDPNPNLNDHVKYQTNMTEWLVRAFKALDHKVDNHLEHSKMMDQALAEVYMEVRPKSIDWPDDDLPKPPT